MTPKQIKTIRKQAGLTQSGLAALLRISDIRTIRRWETGEIQISGPASIVMQFIDEGLWPVK